MPNRKFPEHKCSPEVRAERLHLLLEIFAMEDEHLWHKVLETLLLAIRNQPADWPCGRVPNSGHLPSERGEGDVSGDEPSPEHIEQLFREWQQGGTERLGMASARLNPNTPEEPHATDDDSSGVVIEDVTAQYAGALFELPGQPAVNDASVEQPPSPSQRFPRRSRKEFEGNDYGFPRLAPGGLRMTK